MTAATKNKAVDVEATALQTNTGEQSMPPNFINNDTPAPASDDFDDLIDGTSTEPTGTAHAATQATRNAPGKGNGATGATNAPQGDLANIPSELRQIDRWAPWRYTDNPRGGKPLKRPDVSTATPEFWYPFDRARKLAEGTKATGIGFVMTDGLGMGITVLDIDRCIDDNGDLNEFARGIVNRANSYTETSPSGRGLRVVVRGTGAQDFLRDVIELYSGHRSRYVTMTGRHLAGTPTTINYAQPLIDELVATYATTTSAAVKHRPVPDIPAKLPPLASVDIPHADRAFLAEGEGRTDDDSQNLFAATCALCKVINDDATVLGVLLESKSAYSVAETHWPRSDEMAQIEAATEYLWAHHVLAARAKVGTPAAVQDLFDTLDAMPGPGEEPTGPKDTKRKATLRPTEHVIDGLLATGLTHTAGAHGVGKTSLLVSLASLATGELPTKENGPRASLQRKVLYIAEDPGQVENIRYGLQEHHGATLDSDWFIVRQAVRMKPEDVAKLVEKTMRALAVRHPSGYIVRPAIFFDTTNGCFEIDNENDSSQVGRIMAAIKAPMGSGAVFTVGHLAKVLLRAQLEDLTGRGSGAWEADATTTAFIVRHDTDDNKRILATRKRRFETRTTEIAFLSMIDEVDVPTPWGTVQRESYRHGALLNSDPSERAQVRDDAKAATARADLIHDRDLILDKIVQFSTLHGRPCLLKSGAGGGTGTGTGAPGLPRNTPEENDAADELSFDTARFAEILDRTPRSAHMTKVKRAVMNCLRLGPKEHGWQPVLEVIDYEPAKKAPL